MMATDEPSGGEVTGGGATAGGTEAGCATGGGADGDGAARGVSPSETTESSASAHTDGRDRRRVLVPIDDSAESRTALEYAVTEFPDAVLSLLHVIDPIDAGYSTGPAPPGEGPEWYEKRREAATSLFEEAGALADGADVSYETAVELGRPVTCIVGAVADHDVDHVVMGSHGRSGVSRILRGSVAEAVVRRSPVPVTVVR